MTNTKLIFEELYRIREMMGVKTNSKKLMTEVKMLLTEGKGEELLRAAYRKLAGLSDEAVTAFAKSEQEFVKLTDNILKASGKNTLFQFIYAFVNLFQLNCSFLANTSRISFIA